MAIERIEVHVSFIDGTADHCKRACIIGDREFSASKLIARKNADRKRKRLTGFDLYSLRTKREHCAKQ